jgi:hypothetical protein
MNDQVDFSALVDRAMTQPGLAHMRPVVEKELLHYDILFSLDDDGLLDKLTFQGGTSLRLCYGAPRYSEDLDFAGGSDFSSEKAGQIRACIEKHIGHRYGLEVSVKEPKELKHDPQYDGVNVDKWQVSVVTAPERRDIPQQRVKIEVASIPAWTREPRSLHINYDFLPDGYGDTLILTETLNEIVADKLVSLVNTEKYVRHRDIWDLRWLKQKNAEIDITLVKKKLEDYRVTEYTDKLESMRERLPDIIQGESFRNEMRRFLPGDVWERTLEKEKFSIFLINEIKELLGQTKHLLLD